MTWRGVAILAVAVVGLVWTTALGVLSGHEVVELWAAFLATIVALSGHVFRSERSSKPPPPPLWPVGILMTDDAVRLVFSLAQQWG